MIALTFNSVKKALFGGTVLNYRIKIYINNDMKKHISMKTDKCIGCPFGIVFLPFFLSSL